MDKFAKALFLLVAGFMVFGYIGSKTHHRLPIPQDLDGISVVKVTDGELEDNVADILKIPLKLLPREICLTNHNRVYSDDVEVLPNNDFPDVGLMNLYIEKDNEQLIEKISLPVGETDCRPIDPSTLEGATTTANYSQMGFVKFQRKADGTLGIIGAHWKDNGFEINIRTDVSKTNLSVGLDDFGYFLLFLLSSLATSTIILALVELLKKIKKFIYTKQFFDEET